MKMRAWAMMAATVVSMGAVANSEAAYSFLWSAPYRCDIPGLEGHTVHRIYAGFSNPGDRLVGVFADSLHPMTITATGGFYQHPKNGYQAPTNQLIADDPLAEWDSFVTIGLARAPLGVDQTFTTPGYPDLPFVNFSSGGWFLFPSGPNQGAPDMTGRVLIAQLTLPPGSQMGLIRVNLAYRPAGSANTVQVYNELPVLLPYQFADLDNNLQVNVNDLLLVINSWGQTGPGIADPTDDGVTNVDDLMMVINHWGSFEFCVD